MLKTSSHMSELAKSSNILYELTDNEKRGLKSCLLEIFEDVQKVCNKYNLTLMVCGGTALGAVRHGGFIPWDDDLDVMMPRRDYNKFLDIFENELSQNYYLYAPNTKHGATNTFAKVMKKNTTMLDLYNAFNEYKKGIYIDIFPIEYVPNNLLLRRIKGFVCDVFAYLSVSTRMYKDQNELMWNYVSGNRRSLNNYRMRLFLGAIFSFCSYERWYDLYDKFVQSNKSRYCTIPTGRKHYSGETLKAEVYFPPSEGIFEGIKVMLPNNPDAYLKNLYGDYMQIPPLEKRERHYFVKIDFEKESKM